MADCLHLDVVRCCLKCRPGPGPSLSVFRFPSDYRRQLWIDYCRRYEPNFVPKPSHRLCSVSIHTSHIKLQGAFGKLRFWPNAQRVWSNVRISPTCIHAWHFVEVRFKVGIESGIGLRFRLGLGLGLRLELVLGLESWLGFWSNVHLPDAQCI